MASHNDPSGSSSTNSEARRGSMSNRSTRPSALASAAPPGRVVASDFPASIPNASSMLRFAAAGGSNAAAGGGGAGSGQPGSSHVDVYSPNWHNGRPDSLASISSLGSDEGMSDVEERRRGRRALNGDEEDDEHLDSFDLGPMQSNFQSSLVSDAAQLLNPNLYLHAQEAWDQWNNHFRVGGGTEDDETAPGIAAASESAIERLEHMSERASLLSTSLAQRRTYGALPPQPPEESAISSIRHRERLLSAIHDQPVHNEATMRDAMKTADIGGTPGSNLGLVLIAIAQLCYSAMNLFVTLLDEREGEGAPGRGGKDGRPPITALEVVFVECFIIWLGATIAMLLFRTPHPFLGPPGVRLLLTLRGIFGFLSTVFLYVALQSISLSDTTSITFLGPLVTGVTAALVLGEPFSVREACAGFGSLIGVLLIAKPSAIFGVSDEGNVPSSGGGDTPPIERGDEPADASKRALGVVVALLSVLSTAGAWVSLRKIGRSASTYHSIAYFASASWILALAGMLALGQPFVMPESIQNGFLLAMVGIFSLGAQVAQTLGLQRESAARAATMSYLQIIFATFFQVVIIGTPLEFLSVVGSVLILANGAWVAASKNPEDLVAGH